MSEGKFHPQALHVRAEAISPAGVKGKGKREEEGNGDEKNVEEDEGIAFADDDFWDLDSLSSFFN